LRKIFSLIALALLLSCSGLEDTTGLGRDIISSTNPSAVNIDQNFRTFSRNESIVTGFFSIPDENGTSFGIHPGLIAAGSKDGYITSGYTEFTIDKNAGARFELGDEPVSISLTFDTLDYGTVAFKNLKLSLYQCAQDQKFSRSSITPEGKLIGELAPDSTVENRLSVEINDDKLVSEIFSACLALKECYDKCGDNKGCKDTCYDSLEAKTFSFCLYNEDDSSFIRLSQPLMRITLTRDTSTITDSIKPSYFNYVAQDENIDEQKALPVSSNVSGRTAVFKIDISSLWDTMSTSGFDEILSAGFNIIPETHINFDKEKDTTFAVRHYISDNLIQDGSELDSLFFSRSFEFKIEKDSKGRLKKKLILYADRHLQKYRSKRPSTVFLYLQISKSSDMSWEKVIWKKPVFNAVLTTIK
jgi:hypothetical protein